MVYEPSSTNYNPEWEKRMQRLLDRGLTPEAASVVLNAAMYGIGCIEGEVRARIEAERKIRESN